MKLTWLFLDPETDIYGTPKALGGIRLDPAGPGFKKILIKPNVVGDLHWVRSWYDSVHGRIVKLSVKVGGLCGATSRISLDAKGQFNQNSNKTRTIGAEMKETQFTPLISRREVIKTIGLLVLGGMMLSQLPRFAFADNLPPEQRAKRLAELMDERRLFDRGERCVYRGERLAAISLPVGGIAAGPIQINGEARRHCWQIFRNYQAVALPDSFFAVRAGRVTRVLQTVKEGTLAPMKSLSFSGEYPFGWYHFEDPALPVQVQMEVFSPLIPLNTKDSSIPCAIFNLTAENTGKEPIRVDFLATQQNPIGIQPPVRIDGRVCPQYGGNINAVVHENGMTLVNLYSDRSVNNASHGSLALATPAIEAKATAQWESGFDFKEVTQAGPTPACETVDSAIVVPFTLKPGEKRTVTFVLAWHFPNTMFVAEKRHIGNKYANWWPDALSVARDVTARLESLTAQTRLYNEALYATNLPFWLMDRISSQVAILGSMTCHWAKDDFFYAFEGCGIAEGSCSGNCTHVWGYPQAHARLFPEIARRMREEEFAFMRPYGALPTRFQEGPPVFDGTCHEIIAALREHQINPAWLGTQWPAIKQAVDYMIGFWDKDEDGMLSGPQRSTLDCPLGGTSSVHGGLYLCALSAAAQMARLQNDTAAAERYGKIIEVGKASQDKALFNGEYFIQVPDSVPRYDYLNGCYIDQMLGQWWALQVNLGWLYPQDHVRKAMESIFRYNFHTDFHGFRQVPRRFCVDDDAGMNMCTWPKGGGGSILYHNEIMSGFEYTAACLMMQCGLLREGLTVLHAVSDRYDGRLRTGLSGGSQASWGYSGNPFGDDECGKFYARAMSIWGVLVACQGLSYDATTAAIGFAPIWKPQDHVSFFTAAEGWGNYRQQQTGSAMTASLGLKYGRLKLKTLALIPPAGAVPKEVKALLGNQSIPAKLETQSGQTRVVFDQPLTLSINETLIVNLQ